MDRTNSFIQVDEIMACHAVQEPEEIVPRCALCADDVSEKTHVTLHCLHTYCLPCVKTTHETAVQKEPKDTETLYCPRCACPTTVPGGCVENIRSFFVSNRVKDLQVLTQRIHETSVSCFAATNAEDPFSIEANMDGDACQENIDSRSYTIEGPSADDMQTVDEQLAQVAVSLKNQEAMDLLVPLKKQEARVVHDDMMKCMSATFPEVEETFEQNDKQKNRMRCVWCETADSVRHCFHCSSGLCVSCLEDHDVAEESKDHFTVDIAELDASWLICSQHEEFAKKVCTTCKTPVCDICYSNGHKDHNVCEISFPEKDRNVILSGKGNNRKIVREINQLSKRIKRHINAIASDVSDFAQKNGSNESLVSDMDTAIQQFKAELNSAMQRKMSSYLDRKHNLADKKDQNKETVLTQIELDDTVTKCYKQSPVLGYVKVQKLKTARARVRELCTQPAKEYEVARCIAPSPKLEELVFFQELPPAKQAHLTTKTTTHDTTGAIDEIQSSDRQTEESELTTLAEWGNGVPERLETPSTPLDIVSLAITKASLATIWSVGQPTRCVRFLPDWSLIAVGDDELHLLDIAVGQRLPLPFPSSDLQEPWKLAVHHRTSRVAVVDPSINGFVLFSPTPQLPNCGIVSSRDAWSCETCKVNGVHVPMSVAFSNDGHILVATGSGRVLLKYTPTGELLWEKALPHDCYHIATDHKDRIITSGGGSVHIFDSNGNELRPFPQEPKLIEDPWGICVDNHNNIYVCELNRPLVVVFTSTGRYIRDIQLESWPRDIALQDNKLIIGTIHNIELYQIQ